MSAQALTVPAPRPLQQGWHAAAEDGANVRQIDEVHDEYILYLRYTTQTLSGLGCIAVLVCMSDKGIWRAQELALLAA